MIKLSFEGWDTFALSALFEYCPQAGSSHVSYKLVGNANARALNPRPPGSGGLGPGIWVSTLSRWSLYMIEFQPCCPRTQNKCGIFYSPPPPRKSGHAGGTRKGTEQAKTFSTNHTATFTCWKNVNQPFRLSEVQLFYKTGILSTGKGWKSNAVTYMKVPCKLLNTKHYKFCCILLFYFTHRKPRH